VPISLYPTNELTPLLSNLYTPLTLDEVELHAHNANMVFVRPRDRSYSQKSSVVRIAFSKSSSDICLCSPPMSCASLPTR